VRDIKFRGFGIENKSWIIGSVVKRENHFSWIFPHNQETLSFLNLSQVKTETVGEYTGLKDKNDVEVYEGDVIAVSDQSKNYQIQEVVFKDGMFCGYGDKKSCPYTSLDVLTRAYKIEVIGNKFQNIDLMGVK